jgi:hypothetical protein
MTKKWSGKVQFKHKVKDYAKQIGIEINTLTIRPMANKWASCSTDGNLNFNQELLTIEKKHSICPWCYFYGFLVLSFFLRSCSRFKSVL